MHKLNVVLKVLNDFKCCHFLHSQNIKVRPYYYTGMFNQVLLTVLVTLK